MNLTERVLLSNYRVKEKLTNQINTYKLEITFLTLNHSDAFGIDQHDIEIRRDLLENIIKQLETI